MDKEQIIQVVQQGDVAYQFADSLMDFDDGSKTNLLVETICSSTCELVKCEDQRIHDWDLTDWAREDDILIFSEANLLLCFTPKMLSFTREIV